MVGHRIAMSNCVALCFAVLVDWPSKDLCNGYYSREHSRAVALCDTLALDMSNVLLLPRNMLKR